MALTRLPGSKWWIETDDATGDMIAQHNKAQITADIAAIRETLNRYPVPSQDAADVADLLAAIAGRWTEAKRARIVALVNQMYADYQGSATNLEAARLQTRLDDLIALRERLV